MIEDLKIVENEVVVIKSLVLLWCKEGQKC